MSRCYWTDRRSSCATTSSPSYPDIQAWIGHLFEEPRAKNGSET